MLFSSHQIRFRSITEKAITHFCFDKYELISPFLKALRPPEATLNHIMHKSANTAIIYFENPLIWELYELSIDTDFTELVLNNCNYLISLIAEDKVQQSSLSRTQKTT